MRTKRRFFTQKLLCISIFTTLSLSPQKILAEEYQWVWYGSSEGKRWSEAENWNYGIPPSENSNVEIRDYKSAVIDTIYDNLLTQKLGTVTIDNHSSLALFQQFIYSEIYGQMSISPYFSSNKIILGENSTGNISANYGYINSDNITAGLNENSEGTINIDIDYSACIDQCWQEGTPISISSGTIILGYS